MTDASCVFCRIAAGEFGTQFVYEDDYVVAFVDMHPQAPTHVLVIPRRHVDSLASASDDLLLGKVLGGARQAAARLGVVASGYRTVINTGAGAGQSVFHLHAHVLAGRPLAWPPG